MNNQPTNERPAIPVFPTRGGELTLLNGFLEDYRASLLDRAWGLSQEQLQVALPPSNLTLAGLISHMMMVEDNWFRVRLLGLDRAEPWASLDFTTDRDAEMTIGHSWSVEELHERFHATVADSRSRVAAAASLDQLSVKTTPSGDNWDLRWIMIHMIEEYARHCGHADLIRESIDGDTNIDH